MHKINQNCINCKGKQNKDIIYEKQIYIKKPSTIQWLAHIPVSNKYMEYFIFQKCTDQIITSKSKKNVLQKDGLPVMTLTPLKY